MFSCINFTGFLSQWRQKNIEAATAVFFLMHITLKHTVSRLNHNNKEKHFLSEVVSAVRNYFLQIRMIDTSRYQEDIYFLPCSSAALHNWLLLNHKKSPAFLQAFPWPLWRFCTATCCCDWGLRGLTAINAEGLATENLTGDPCSHSCCSLCLTWRSFCIHTCQI